MEEQFVTGVLEQSFLERRFGFIKAADGTKIFLHQKAIKNGHSIPPVGTRMKFFIAPPHKEGQCLRAVNAEVL